MAAFQRGRRYLAPGGHSRGNAAPTSIDSPIGVGCTASLASDRPKRRAHRIHVAVQTREATVTFSLELIKRRRDRVQEEELAATMVLNTAAEALKIESRLALPTLENEQVEINRTTAPTEWQDLLLGRIEAVRQPASISQPRAVFPGAFNPLHQGHLRMAEIAAKLLGAPVEYELSIENVDKPPLDYTEMQERLAQFAEKSLPLWFTRARRSRKNRGSFWAPPSLWGRIRWCASVSRNITATIRRRPKRRLPRLTSGAADSCCLAGY